MPILNNAIATMGYLLRQQRVEGHNTTNHKECFNSCTVAFKENSTIKVTDFSQKAEKNIITLKI